MDFLGHHIRQLRLVRHSTGDAAPVAQGAGRAGNAVLEDQAGIQRQRRAGGGTVQSWEPVHQLGGFGAVGGTQGQIDLRTLAQRYGEFRCDVGAVIAGGDLGALPLPVQGIEQGRVVLAVLLGLGREGKGGGSICQVHCGDLSGLTQGQAGLFLQQLADA